MTTFRHLAPAALVSVLLWFAFHAVSWPDIPGELLFLLPLFGTVVIGVAWPGAGRGLAVGLAALAGVIVDAAISRDLDAMFSGESVWFGLMATASIATAMQTTGTVVRGRLQPDRMPA